MAKRRKYTLEERVKFEGVDVLSGLMLERFTPEPRPKSQKDKVKEAPKTKGLARSMMTARKTVKGEAQVFGKGALANTMLGTVVFSSATGTWKFLRKGRTRLSSESFKTKKMAIEALGMTY